MADVQAALGAPGSARAFNIPTAAQVLGLYAMVFARPQADLDALVTSMRQTRASLARS